ncbi:hypothetical protein GGI21_002861 [Coemansia aciculifera]|nr:hypothetical protein GGI21_002861 [Coemansia aciculifera]
MAYVPTQPVGGRLRFLQPPPSQPSLGQASPSPFAPAGGLRGIHTEFQTPTRPSNSNNVASSSPFRTSQRHNSYLGAEAHANPFTPRIDRGLSSATATGGRRGVGSTLLSTGSSAARGTSANGHGLGSVDGSGFGGGGALQSDFASVGAGAWPVDLASNNDRVGGAGGGDAAIRSPFGTRPKSPAQRSASPRRRTKLPSFLLGSAQLARSPAKTSSVHLQDSELTPTTPNNPSASMFGLSSPQIRTPLAAANHPISPRRLSGFGSNDMLSNAYMSSMPPNPRAAAFAHDDAPPVKSLDDMDDEQYVRASDGMDEDPFAMNHQGGGGSGASYAHADGARTSSEDGDARSEEEYENVRIRSVVMRGLPAETEASGLNYFGDFGELLAYDVVSAGVLTVLYAEPWQAQRAVGQADEAGQVLIGGRTLASVAWADETSVAALFTRVFPQLALPKSAEPPAMESFTLAETIYAQSPQGRTAAAARQPPYTPRAVAVGSRLNAVQALAATNGDKRSMASPFKQKQSLYSRSNVGGNGCEDGVLSGTTYSSASVLRTGASASKPSNGLWQNAIDILFGW